MSVKFQRDSMDVPIPKRGTPYSVGWDLAAIKVHKKLNDTTTLYDTGIKVIPPAGYYTEIIPRSSLSKTGYMLANSVGIIDCDYRENLLIALTKIDKNSPELELPFTRCQLVLRKAEYFTMDEIDNVQANGRGSFGSTD